MRALGFGTSSYAGQQEGVRAAAVQPRMAEAEQSCMLEGLASLLKVAVVVSAVPAACGASAALGPPPHAGEVTTWKERAARAEAWLKAKSEEAEEVAAQLLARARVELFGVDGQVHAPSLRFAVRAEAQPIEWQDISDPAAVTAPLPERIVLLVHGLDEPGTIFDELTPHLLDRGAAVVRFDYPNDQAIARSGAALAQARDRLASMGVRRISIVAHSMGGLVARDALTRPSLSSAAPGPIVDRLIMLGTPNAGTHMASLQPLADAREQVVRRVQGTSREGTGLVGAAVDGRGEAGEDLKAGSAFLRSLNAQPLPEGVKITTIAGTLTPAAAAEFLRHEAASKWAPLLGQERAAALAQQAQAALETVGDGMVPAASTRIAGVEDHVELAADHRAMVKRWTLLVKLDELRGVQTPPAPAIPVILNRLGLDDQRPSEEGRPR